MFPRLAYRVARTTAPKALWKLCWNAGVRGTLSIQKFKRGVRKGEFFPPFLHFSITNSCNLRCQGCWVDVEAPEERLEPEVLNRAICEAKEYGNAIFGILGGEPFQHPQLLEILAAHPDCYFQVFTNGQFITEKVAARLRQLGNVTPLISIEGLEAVSDTRRGKREVFSRSLRGLEQCTRAGLLTGVATSVCQSNMDDLLSEAWLRRLIELGVHYVWYYAYRPVGPRPNHQLALRPDQQLRFRRFIVEMRSRMPICIIETYFDEQGRALCPMATGLSHHVSPRGEIEPCPIIQFARENISDPGGLVEVVRRSAFLKDFRQTAAQAMRGCIVLERPDLIEALVRKHQARDSTSRGTALAEMQGREPASSQWMPGYEVPEGHWMYRLAKKFGFNDFGAYDGVNHDAAGRHRAIKISLDRSPITGDNAASHDG